MDKPPRKNAPPKGALQRVAEYLFGSEPEKPQQPKSRAVERAPELAKVLRSETPLPSKMQAGTLQLVGLSYIREALGADWEPRRERIHAIVESAFRRYLEPTDAYYRIDDEQFLVLFTKLPHAQAQAKADAISREVQQLVLGEVPDGHQITVTSRVAEVDRKLLMEKVSSLGELLDYVKTGALAAAGGEDVTFFEPVGGDDAPPAPPAAPPLTGAGPDMADLDQSLGNLFQTTSAAAYLKECSACFEPVFDVKRKAFTCFQVKILHQGMPPLSEDLLLIDDADGLRFNLDRYALLTGALGLQQMLAQNIRGMIVMPVHFTTLIEARTRNVYLKRLREVPPSFRNYIGFTIVGTAPGTPALRVADLLSYLQPLSRMQDLQLPADPKAVDFYAAAGVHSVSASAAISADGDDEATPQRQALDLAGFARRARAHKMDAVLLDLDDRDMVRLGAAAGFTLLAGRAVADSANGPVMPGIGAVNVLSNVVGTVK